VQANMNLVQPVDITLLSIKHLVKVVIAFECEKKVLVYGTGFHKWLNTCFITVHWTLNVFVNKKKFLLPLDGY